MRINVNVKVVRSAPSSKNRPPIASGRAMGSRHRWAVVLVFLLTAMAIGNGIGRAADPAGSASTVTRDGGPRHTSAESGSGSQSFGTATATSDTTHAFEFAPYTAADVNLLATGTLGSRHCTADCNLVAGVSLPAGALITGVHLQACDETASGHLIVHVVKVPSPTGTAAALSSHSTGTSATPGCHISSAPPFSHQVDNASNSYFVLLFLRGGTNAIRFQAVRVHYQLQISQPPSKPTFDDVATNHLFYRQIEALAASGITSGCDAESYCPGATVTRAQMAAFFARALGLHFAP